MFGSARSGSEAAAGEIRCTRCDVYGNARAHCRAVVQLRFAPSPPLHTFFDVRLLPPGYHFTDYSFVLTSTALASLPQQKWVVEQQQQQQKQKQKQQQAGEIRCTRCDVYGHARAHCRAVVQLRFAPSPPLHTFFDVGLLPPSYHFTDYSFVLTSTTLASLPQQKWVVEQQQQQQKQKQKQQQAGEIRCTRCDVYGHARAHCRAVVQLRFAPSPPLHTFFDVGLLPPSYHFTDYSFVLTSTTLASLPQQKWVVEQQQQQQKQKQEQQQQWALDEQKRLLDTPKQQLEQQRQWLDQQQLQQWLEQQRRQQYEQQQQQEPQQEFCSGVIPRAGEHGILIIKREGEKLPVDTEEREDSLVAADTRAGQMTQLPGAREEMIPPSQLITPMGDISPGGSKEQEDMLVRPEGQPKMRKRECAPEGVHDQQEDLLNREQTTRECVPEGMRNKQEDLFHRNMNAHQGDKVDYDMRNPTETRRNREPRTAMRAARRRTRKRRGKERGNRVVGRGSACKLRRTTRPKRARARERQKQADDPVALPWSRFLTAKFL